MAEYSVSELLLFQAILILFNAVFACAEIAVISMNDSKLTKLAEAGDKRAMRLASLTKQPAKFLATIQVGITLAGFLGSAFAADNFSDRIVDWLIAQGVTIAPAKLDVLAVIFITLVLSYVTLIFGELVPKRIAMQYAAYHAVKSCLSRCERLPFTNTDVSGLHARRDTAQTKCHGKAANAANTSSLIGILRIR